MYLQCYKLCTATVHHVHVLKEGVCPYVHISIIRQPNGCGVCTLRRYNLCRIQHQDLINMPYPTVILMFVLMKYAATHTNKGTLCMHEPLESTVICNHELPQ